MHPVFASILEPYMPSKYPTRDEWKELERLINAALKASADGGDRGVSHKAMWGAFFRLAYRDDPTVMPAEETPARRRTWALAGECLYCDEHRRRGDKHLPPHDASPRCESGKRPHCTCDVCF
jgi:hypothetical protein